MERDVPAAIIVVSAGIMQIPAIRTAKEMGLTVIATDGNPNAPGFEYADFAVTLDTKDVEGHTKFASENRQRLNIRAAFAGSDVAVTVSAITSALALPGIPMDVALRSKNKALMKERWIRDGIPTPRGGEVATLQEARDMVRHVGFPAIIKAVDNAASRGSMKITLSEQVPRALERAKASSRTGTAVVEEYVVGEEQSVESIVWRGHHYHVGMADRFFGYHPYHVETAHVDPSALAAEKQAQIYEVVDAAADSLGITFGPAKADMIWTERGPLILEMPARLSGGFHSQYTTPLSSGRDPIRAVMEIALGRDLDEKLIRGTRGDTAICAGVFPKPGRLTGVYGVDEARGIPGVKEVIITKDQGDLIEAYVDNARRFCWVIVVGQSREDAFAIVNEANNTLRFEVE